MRNTRAPTGGSIDKKQIELLSRVVSDWEVQIASPKDMRKVGRRLKMSSFQEEGVLQSDTMSRNTL